MNAWAFTLCFDEALLIRYWVRHMRTVCDRVIVYLDIDTTDDTANVAIASGAEVRPYQGTGHLDDIAFVEFAQGAYKEARGYADWVIWTDADEILYHPRLAERLTELRAQGVTVARTRGYNMFASSPPAGYGQIYDEIKRGVESPAYSKVCAFDPMLDIAWSTGKHEAYGKGIVRDDGSDPLKLLHYRWLGEKWFLERNARNYARLNQRNIDRQHGRETYPGYRGIYGPTWYAEQAELAVSCI